MGIKYKVVPDMLDMEQIMIHPETAGILGILGQDKVRIRFGTQTYELHVVVSNALRQWEVMIAKKIVNRLRIPLAPWYELLFINQELVVGPYIGMLVTTSSEMLKSKISSLSSYLTNYDQIGGAILAFSLDGVNLADTTINGYLFNPKLNKWERGTYAYPASMFSILEASLTKNWDSFQSVIHHFHSVLGDRIFNYPLFNKWEMYKWLKRVPELQEYLPDTIRYRELEDIYQMLARHDRVYIKPIWGRLGLGVMEAVNENKGLVIRFRKNHQNHQLFLQNRDESDRFFKQVLTRKEFLIQKSIDLLSKDRRIVDFRLMLVKNQFGKWEEMGLFARYGAKNSIVSNITADGTAESGRKTLKKMLNLTSDEASNWKQKMTDVAIEVSKVIESRGVHCGNLGLDLAVDTHRRIWILEINNQNPDHYIALRAGRREIFLQARKANMLYAKKLAGFTESVIV